MFNTLLDNSSIAGGYDQHDMCQQGILPHKLYYTHREGNYNEYNLQKYSEHNPHQHTTHIHAHARSILKGNPSHKYHGKDDILSHIFDKRHHENSHRSDLHSAHSLLHHRPTNTGNLQDHNSDDKGANIYHNDRTDQHIFQEGTRSHR